MVEDRKAKMHVEREGNVDPLTPRIEEFIKRRLGGQSLDEEGDVERRPDFECLRGLLAIEVKSLKTAPKGRLENALQPQKDSSDWPIFFGSWPISSVLKHLPDAEEIQSKLRARLGRAIIDHVKKANDQLKSHTERKRRQNLVRILILLNEDHPEYAPDIVTFFLQKELHREDHRNNQIDAVIYLTERHAAPGDKDTLLPAIAVLGLGSHEAPWKEDVVNLVLSRWVAWNGGHILQDKEVSVDSFVSAEHVPESMARHELWSLQYSRNRYMRKWSDEDIRHLWDYTILMSMLWGYRNTPMKISHDGIMQVFEKYTHVRDEAALRGLPLDFFEKDSAFRRRQVAENMPYGREVTNWLHEMLS